MTREIKFRAWEKAKERMLYGDQLGFDYLDRGSVLSLDKIFASGYFHWMQYTGLKDKNGKEIYEGDIIVSKENNEVYAIGNMTPLDRHLDMLADNIGYFTDSKRKKFEKRSAGGAYHLDDWVSWSEMYEIIGNIYENPDLLANNTSNDN